MSNLTKTMALVFGLSCAALMGLQISLYKKYALEASIIFLKDGIRKAEASDYRRIGAICNSIEKRKCSVWAYRKLYDLQPNDPIATSNLAIHLTLEKKHLEAIPYYKAYFSSGGQGAEVQRWYLQSLKEVEKK